MGKIPSYGKNSHSLFLHLWSSVCVLIYPDFILILSQAERRLCPACPSHTGVPWEWHCPGGTVCGQGTVVLKPSNSNMTYPHFLAGRENLFASQNLPFLTSSSVWEPIIKTWCLFWSCFNMWGPLNSSSERFIISWTLNFQSCRLNHKNSPWRENYNFIV